MLQCKFVIKIYKIHPKTESNTLALPSVKVVDSRPDETNHRRIIHHLGTINGKV
uniref:Uncharacterized protein n=1 Tax=Anopheles minimus TaxID=112268 RepID=A0A182WPN7_9DIPT